METKSPQISVIVPVYNVEKFLPRCINSILVQTFTNFELLLIDDGSIDKSGKICDEYARKDCRVRVFHKENGGVSSARNLGLKNIEGKYVTFIDSDDTVNCNYLFNMIKSSNIEKCLIVTGCNVIERNGTIRKYELPDMISYDICDTFSQLEFFKHGSPWSKLFNASIIKSKHLFFNLFLKNYEDLIFCMEYLQYVDAIICVNANDYNYYKYENTLSSIYQGYFAEMFLYEKYSSLLSKLSYKSTKCINKAQNYKSEFIYRAICSLFTSGLICTKCKIKYLKYLKLRYAKEISYSKLNYRHFYHKLLFMILRKNIYLFMFLFSLFNKIKMMTK